MIVHGNEVTTNISEEADVCVVGSGAGGAVVAKELAEAGFSVTLLEEGGDFTPDDFTGRPTEMFPLLYRDGGVTFAIGWPLILIPVGRCLGGTTVVNSGTCFRTPDHVLRKWNREFSLASISPEALAPFFERVEGILNVAPAKTEVLGRNNLVFKRGADSLGYRGRPLSRNVKDCEGCGTCATGCMTGAKLDMRMTYVPMAAEQGARIFSHAVVDKIQIRNHRARGAIV